MRQQGQESLMRIVDPQTDWEVLLSYLPPDYEELGAQHGQLNTQWANNKISTAALLLRFIFLHVGADLPLRQTVAMMAKSGAPRLSQVRLHYRMRQARSYLAALVARMIVPSQEGINAEKWGGYEMVCIDGSSVSGPGSDGTDVRLHVVLRLCDLCVLSAQVTTVEDGETLKRFRWAPGQLVIADRGYANPPGVAHAKDHGAEVLVRVNRSALPVFDNDETQIDVLAWCRQLSGHRATERAATVLHREVREGGSVVRRITGRLIGVRLPAKEAEEARERARREHGAGLTQEHLEAADYVLLFATAPTNRLSAARCVEVYRLRWQIELQLKRWKSICHFDRLPNYRDDTMVSWVTTKLLLGLLLDRIGSAQLAAPQGTSRSPRVLAREPWKLTSVLWPLVVAAIMPIGVRKLLSHIPDMVEHLEAMTSHVDDRQVNRFRDRFYSNDVSADTASQNC
jgi:hypothetical protein